MKILTAIRDWIRGYSDEDLEFAMRNPYYFYVDDLGLLNEDQIDIIISERMSKLTQGQRNAFFDTYGEEL